MGPVGKGDEILDFLKAVSCSQHLKSFPFQRMETIMNFDYS